MKYVGLCDEENSVYHSHILSGYWIFPDANGTSYYGER